MLNKFSAVSLSIRNPGLHTGFNLQLLLMNLNSRYFFGTHLDVNFPPHLPKSSSHVLLNLLVPLLLFFWNCHSFLQKAARVYALLFSPSLQLFARTKIWFAPSDTDTIAGRASAVIRPTQQLPRVQTSEGHRPEL